MIFRSQPEVRHQVRVIGVTINKNTKAKSINCINRSQFYYEVLAPFTTVLYTIDGVLKTKDFDGVWTLTQCKNWVSDKYLR